MSLIHEKLTASILGTFYEVYNTLGTGFLEKVYENALAHELRLRGHEVGQQVAMSVRYKDIVVGEYFADLLVDSAVILELKVAQEIAEVHKAQLLNYLRATNIEVGLILNFGASAQYVRKVMMNDRKPRR